MAEEVEVLTRMKTDGICRVEGTLAGKRGGEGRKTRALLDTGASRSFIAERVLGGEGNEVKVFGERQVNVRVKGFSDGITQNSNKAAHGALRSGKVEREVEALEGKDMSEGFILGIRELRHGGLRITQKERRYGEKDYGNGRMCM